ncbi:hypothetical protein, partial [Helicobacter pylori]|uniref:hypothetical protein n=1 Tax=Helicobacter pylori TaxID=210 RepID=UPI0002BBA63B
NLNKILSCHSVINYNDTIIITNELIGTSWISIPYQRMGVIKTPTLFSQSLLMILEYPFKKNFYQFA